MNKDWSADEDAILRQLRGEGRSFPYIATQIPGRTYGACHSRWCYLHMSGEQLQARRTRSNAKRKSLPSLNTGIHVVVTGRPTEDILVKRDAYVNAPRPLSAWLLGDPPPGYSALDRRG